MTTFIEARHPGEFILSELDGHGSREGVLIGVSQTILPGMLLGAAGNPALETSSVAAAAGNTGNGVVTFASPATSSTARDGDYLLTATSATSFSVQTPDGREIGPATVGAAFNKEVKFTIAAGGTPFAAGDAFTASIGIERPGDYSYGALDPASATGLQSVFGIALYPTINDGATTSKIAAIVRMAEVNGKCLTWPVGITAPQQAEAIEQLRKLGIMVR